MWINYQQQFLLFLQFQLDELRLNNTTTPKYIHSLSSAKHDVGQQQTQDDSDDQGHNHCHNVVWEIVSAWGRLGRIEVASFLQNAQPHCGSRWNGLLLCQINLDGEREEAKQMGSELLKNAASPL